MWPSSYESSDISSLPVPTFWSRDSNPQRLLLDLERTLARLHADRDFLDQEFREALADVETAMNGFANPGVASACDLRRLDFSKLAQRSVELKPRISISIEVVDGHLSCLWHPHHYDLNGEQIHCEEWKDNVQQPGNIFRPCNEILFIRNAHNILMQSIDQGPLGRWLCSSLIAITHSTWNAVRLFLGRTFRVQLRHGLAVTEGRATELGINELDEGFSGENQVALLLSIVDELEQERVRVRALVTDFGKRHRLSIEDFFNMVQECTGNGQTNFNCVAHRITLKGNSNFSAEDAADLFQDISQALQSGIWRPNDKVVSLRRP